MRRVSTVLYMEIQRRVFKGFLSNLQVLPTGCFPFHQLFSLNPIPSVPSPSTFLFFVLTVIFWVVVFGHPITRLFLRIHHHSPFYCHPATAVSLRSLPQQASWHPSKVSPEHDTGSNRFGRDLRSTDVSSWLWLWSRRLSSIGPASLERWFAPHPHRLLLYHRIQSDHRSILRGELLFLVKRSRLKRRWFRFPDHCTSQRPNNRLQLYILSSLYHQPKTSTLDSTFGLNFVYLTPSHISSLNLSHTVNLVTDRSFSHVKKPHHTWPAFRSSFSLSCRSIIV